MSREAVLLQWERKIEAAERLEEEPAHVAEPVELHPEPPARTGRFERSQPAEPAPERRTITITGRPEQAVAPARRRRAVIDAHIAQPDRVALWAFLLGLLLVAVAAGTAHA